MDIYELFKKYQALSYINKLPTTFNDDVLVYMPNYIGSHSCDTVFTSRNKYEQYIQTQASIFTQHNLYEQVLIYSLWHSL